MTALEAEPRGRPFAVGARSYLEAGWQGVLLLPPGEKDPPPVGYTGDEGRFPSPSKIEEWRASEGSGNVALRLPDGVIGIDVDHYGAKSGGDSLALLEEANGLLPDTWISTARDLPSGIRFFRVPDGTKLNDKPGAFIEIIQRHHRYACVWPSTNPKAGGAEYHWISPDGEIGCPPPRPDQLAELPTRWLEALKVGTGTHKATVVSATVDRYQRCQAVDRALSGALSSLYAGHHDAAAQGSMALIRLGSQGYPGADDALEDLGRAFTTSVVDNGTRKPDEADQEWRRLVSGARSKVATKPSTIPKWEERRRDYAAEKELLDRHAGKDSRSSPGREWCSSPGRDLDGTRGDDPDDPEERLGATWQPRDLTDVVAGLQAGTVTRPEPTVGRRDDGVCLFYRGRVNGIQGESGASKSWVLQHVAAQEVSEGRHVVYVDLEDDETGTAGRLLDLGVTPEAILERFHYVHPDEPYGVAASEHLLELVDKVQPSLVVVDSTGEALSLNGVKDQDDEVARWFRLLPKPVARRGPAVVTVDHVTKAKDGRGLYAIGSQRKRAAITGSSFMVEPIKGMGKGSAGAAKLVTAKDRCGTHKTGSIAAVFGLDATDLPIKATLTASTNVVGDGDTFRPTTLMEKVSRYLEAHPRSSKNDVEKAKLGKNDYVRLALDKLVEEGFVHAEVDGRATRHSVTKPFREGAADPGEMVS